MAHRRRGDRFKNIWQLAAFRVGMVWRTVEALASERCFDGDYVAETPVVTE